MTTNQLWNAKWLAVMDKSFDHDARHPLNKGGFRGTYTGKQLIDSLQDPSALRDGEFNRPEPWSAMASAMVSLGIELSDYPKLRRAALRSKRWRRERR